MGGCGVATGSAAPLGITRSYTPYGGEVLETPNGSSLLCLDLPDGRPINRPASVSRLRALANVCPTQGKATAQRSHLQKNLKRGRLYSEKVFRLVSSQCGWV